MTHRIFFIADTHFGHDNIIKFIRKDGQKQRKFNTLDEMHQTIIENWNKTVSENDTVYMLGDIVLKRKAMGILGKLNGRKILVKGNHDNFKANEYLEYFEDICAYKTLSKYRIVCSHIPIHSDCMDRWSINIHGHLHYKNLFNKKYICVSVEQTDYSPVSLDEILQQIKKDEEKKHPQIKLNEVTEKEKCFIKTMEFFELSLIRAQKKLESITEKQAQVPDYRLIPNKQLINAEETAEYYKNKIEQLRDEDANNRGY